MLSRRRAVLVTVVAAGAVALMAARRRNRARSAETKGRLRSIWTEVDGLSIHARVSAGPASGARPVVLVHGYGVSGTYMVPLARRLAAELPVWVPDLPGHGRSEKPERALDVPELAEALRAWMDAVGLGRVAFYANSMGCQVVAELAVRHPERVDRLVFAGPTADPAARTAWRQMLRLLRAALAERPSLIPLVVADYLRAGPRRLVAELEALLEHRIEERLPLIDAPAMVLRGEKDAVAPQRWTAEVARMLGADGVHVVPRAGHALNYSVPEELLRRIRPFLCAAQRSPGGRATARAAIGGTASPREVPWPGATPPPSRST